MQACLNFKTKICLDVPKQFEFFDASGSEWFLLHDWNLVGESPDAYTRIQKRMPSVYPQYFVDLEIYTVDGKPVLERNAKGTWNKIEIRAKQNDLLVGLYGVDWEKSPEMHLNEIWNQTFLYKVKLYPAIELRDAEDFKLEKAFTKRGLQRLVRDVGSMFNNPEFGFMNDVVLVSHKIEIKADKNILSSRLPEFSQTLNSLLLPRRKSDDLQVVELPATGLCEMVQFLYTNEYSKTLLSMGNLSIFAKDMGSDTLQEMFLSECFKRLSVENVLYLVYLADLHKLTEFRRTAMTFLLNDFERIRHNITWEYLKIFFTCLNRANRVLSQRRRFSEVHILRFSLIMLIKIYYEK